MKHDTLVQQHNTHNVNVQNEAKNLGHWPRIDKKVPSIS